MPHPTRACASADPAEDFRAEAAPSVPHSPAPHASRPVSTRRVARQATSALAFTPAPEPSADDPLLAFAPFLHPQPRRNSITSELQRRFVATLAATGIVNQAARSIGKSLEALYKLRARPGAEGFAAAWDEALAWGADRLEDCALERAMREEWDFDGWKGRADGLLIYLIRLRSAFRIDEREIVPGHAVYERIRADVLAAQGKPGAG